MQTTQSALQMQAQQLAKPAQSSTLSHSYRKGWLQAQHLLEQWQQQKLKKA